MNWFVINPSLVLGPQLPSSRRRIMQPRLWLIRHGETEWTLSGAHTGATDIPLNEMGRREASALKDRLMGRTFALVLTSPLSRAHETCNLAGYGAVARIEPDLVEWRYGDYEGRTAQAIRSEVPGWSIWRCGVPNGEGISEVASRAERVIRHALRADGDVALFGHGHILRILAARWLELPPEGGSRFALGTAAISILGYEHDVRVITHWNIDGNISMTGV
jgi:broad specificity phosphatase PhoE